MLAMPEDLLCYKQIKIQNKDKAQFFLNQHSTKEGSWGRLTLKAGTIDFIFMDQDNNELSCQRLSLDHPDVIIFPGALHRIKLIDTDNFSADINFYCLPHRYFPKKYALGNVHSDLLYAYNNYFPKQKKLTVLDVGCGSGRNLLFLAKQGHSVTGLDINNAAIEKIQGISLQEQMDNIKTICTDLNMPIKLVDDAYDLIISTVSLQFLHPSRVASLLIQLRAATKVGGIHLLVFPIEKTPFQLPEKFTFLPQEKELYEDYQNAGWALFEYKETVGQLHKLDEFGSPIQGMFGFLLAQRIH